MNYNDPKDKEFIEKLVQEYIDIQDQKSGSQFSKEFTKEELLNKFKNLRNQLIKEIEKNQSKENLNNHQHGYLSSIIQILNYIIPESNLEEYYYRDYRPEGQRIPTVEELLKGTYDNKKEYKIASERYQQTKDNREKEK